MDGQNVQGGNGNNILGGGTSSQGLEILRTGGTENWAPDGQHQSPFYDYLNLPDFEIGPDQLSNLGESSASTSLDSNKHKKSGGRPKKILTMEELNECKGYTLEAAAKELGVSVATMKRRITDLTGKGWSEFQRGIPNSQRLREKETMQDEDKVLIGVDYKGESYIFDLTKIKKPQRFQELKKLLKKSFKLRPKTYHVKYVRGEEEHTVFNSDTLQGCLSLADQFNPIKLKVFKVIDADKRT